MKREIALWIGIILIITAIVANFIIPRVILPLSPEHEELLQKCRKNDCIEAITVGADFGKPHRSQAYSAICYRTCLMRAGSKKYLFYFNLKARKLVKLYELTKNDDLIIEVALQK